jgi:very-short-patch-repair endonuclease
MIAHKNKEMIPVAQKMRKSMTPQERKLWFLFLQKNPVRFYRQRVIDSFIADFYCASARLVIEIDGAQHYLPDSIEYDKRRTEYLSNAGNEVIRFLNKDINCNFENVCAYIDKIVKQRVG